MKLTKQDLVQLIKEELNAQLSEAVPDDSYWSGQAMQDLVPRRPALDTSLSPSQTPGYGRDDRYGGKNWINKELDMLDWAQKYTNLFGQQGTEPEFPGRVMDPDQRGRPYPLTVLNPAEVSQARSPVLMPYELDQPISEPLPEDVPAGYDLMTGGELGLKETIRQTVDDLLGEEGIRRKNDPNFVGPPDLDWEESRGMMGGKGYKNVRTGKFSHDRPDAFVPKALRGTEPGPTDWKPQRAMMGGGTNWRNRRTGDFTSTKPEVGSTPTGGPGVEDAQAEEMVRRALTTTGIEEAIRQAVDEILQKK